MIDRVYLISFDDAGVAVEVKAAIFEIAVPRAMKKAKQLYPGVNLDGKISGRRVA